MAVQSQIEIEPLNEQGRVFQEQLPRLQRGLQSAILSIAQRCNVKGLITDQLYQRVFDSQWDTGNKRTSYFINCIYKRLQSLETLGKQKQVEEEIKKLADIFGKESALKDMAQLIRTCKSSADWKEKSDELQLAISSDISRIAVSAMSAKIITHNEYIVCVLPDANNDMEYTQRILTAIASNLRDFPENLYVFIEILKKKERPIKNYGEALEKAMGERPPDIN